MTKISHNVYLQSKKSIIFKYFPILKFSFKNLESSLAQKIESFPSLIPQVKNYVINLLKMHHFFSADFILFMGSHSSVWKTCWKTVICLKNFTIIVAGNVSEKLSSIWKTIWKIVFCNGKLSEKLYSVMENFLKNSTQ